MGNTLKTTLLLAGLTGLLIAVGGAFGGRQGMVMAFFFAAVMNFGAYWFSDKIVLAMYRAQEVSQAEAPELHAIVDNLIARAGLPKPKVYIIPTNTPNAFATGRNPSHAAVAVTQGIMRMLEHDELEAVLGHELAHVRSRDILTSSIAATIAGAIGMLASWARWAAIFGGFGGRDDDDRGNIVELMFIALVVPLMATIIQLAVSRSREYAADAAGAEISGKPLQLASALLKLERGAQMVPMDANPATSHMFIVSPLSGEAVMRLLSTHPATADRVARLEAMAHRYGPRMAPPDRYFS